jgi:hypothetical protein
MTEREVAYAPRLLILALDDSKRSRQFPTLERTLGHEVVARRKFEDYQSLNTDRPTCTNSFPLLIHLDYSHITSVIQGHAAMLKYYATNRKVAVSLPMSLGFSIDVILPAALCLWV